MTDKIVILSACDSEEQAARLARHLVELRLAACVNIVPGARSIYRWKGAIEEASEWLLVIKSRRDLFSSIQSEIAKTHSYEVPELLALPVVEGAVGYLEWMDRELAPVEDE
jgi:periplasmic divalent cation tolerance protein